MPDTPNSVGSKRVTILGVVLAALAQATDFKLGVLITILGALALIGVTATDMQKLNKPAERE